ncbi:MAG: hypothetical protein MJK04_36795 [Psychrosphaera sp.]|nr:hypothetical protein [Psychrosphaera sp.]
MKIDCQLGIIESSGVIGGQLFRSHEGILFNGKHKVDLGFYLKGVFKCVVYSSSQLRVLLIDQEQKNRVFNYPSFEEVTLPGPVKYLFSLNSQFAVFDKETDTFSGSEVFDFKKHQQVEIADTAAVSYIDEQRLILKNNEKVVCYSWQGELTWQHSIERTRMGTNKRLIEVSNALTLDAGAGLLLCIEKSSGAIVWQLKFDQVIDSLLLLGDFLHVAVGREMYLISPEHGKIDKQFTATALSQDEDKTMLYSDGFYYYVIASRSQRILVFDQALNSVGDVNMPTHPVLKFGKIPVNHNGVTSLCLVGGHSILAGVEAGLLTWSPKDIEKGVDLNFAPTPQTTVITTEDKKGKESYHVYVDTNDIHKLIRFGEIETRRVASYKGKHGWADYPSSNKKFNGEIVLEVRFHTANMPKLRAKC